MKFRFQRLGQSEVNNGRQVWGVHYRAGLRVNRTWHSHGNSFNARVTFCGFNFTALNRRGDRVHNVFGFVRVRS